MMVVARLRVVGAQRIEAARQRCRYLYRYLSCCTGLHVAAGVEGCIVMPQALEDTFL